MSVGEMEDLFGLLWIDKVRAKYKTYMSVGVMKD
jgi:hypothetical protein